MASSFYVSRKIETMQTRLDESARWRCDGAWSCMRYTSLERGVGWNTLGSHTVTGRAFCM